ncbi:hypothetical protein Tco_1195668 [Tanacetum coccineum]
MSKEELIGLVDKIKSGALDDVISRLSTTERQATHGLVIELARGFDYSVSIQDKPSSYVGAAGGSTPEPSKTKANFRSLFLENSCEGAKFSIPRKVVETVSTQFDNTLYGYFIGKCIAFLVMKYYVRNNWVKYGLTRIMMNSKGFFFFQFKTSKGLEDALERLLSQWFERLLSSTSKAHQLELT